MTNTSVSVPRPVNDFRVGRVFDRTISIYTRNFLIFTLVPVVAFVPLVLLAAGAGGMAYGQEGLGITIMLLGVALTVIFMLLSQAILVYASFQDMRGKRVNLGDSFNVALTRLAAIIGLAVLAGISTLIGLMLFLIPGLILLTMWFVAVPACVVERHGPWDSMVRSAQLTKGYRWQIFGITLLLYLVSNIVERLIPLVVGAIGGTVVALIALLLWYGIWGAFFAVFVVVTYYELRVAKEGIDIEQIASVFD